MHTRSRFTTAAAACAVVGAAVLGGGPALAAWSKSSTGAGVAAATSLVTPTDVNAARDSEKPGSKITVSWSAPSQLPGVTYSVLRDGTPVSGCTDIQGSAPLSCSDAGRSPKTAYEYVVRAKLGASWIEDSAGVTASTVGLALVAPSTVTAGTPATFTVKTVDASGAVVTSLGTRSLRWTGDAAAASPNNTTNTLPANVDSGSSTFSSSLFKSSGGSPVALTVTDGGDLGSASANVTVNPGSAARLVLKNISLPGANPTCTAAECGPFVLGNGGSASTGLEIWDAYENVARASTPIAVTAAKSNNGSSLTTTSSTIATGASSTGTWTYTAPTNGNYNDTITFSVAGGTPSSVVLRFKRQ